MQIKRKITALFLTFALAACEGAPDGPQIETTALDNGLEIIVIPDYRADVVTHMLWYRVGRRDTTTYVSPHRRDSRE